MTIRTRFAPSPTGALHVGNVRVAVFNWLFARHHGGRFVLRMEDTDVERNVAESAAGIMEDLRWLGLSWDEGPDLGGEMGPYRQSARGSLYLEAARSLVDQGGAYPCYCTAEELGQEVEDVGHGEEVLRYSGRCRDLTDQQRRAFEEQGRSPVLRFRTPGSDVEVEDEIRGTISFPESDLTDFVIIRADRRATYNFAVVVDDILMEISHVIRGAGHLSNTPKQALLFDAFGEPRPRFAHLPMVLGEDRRKLSKREGAATVSDLRVEGYPPEAVVNYLSLLGWSHPEEKEILSREELIDAVDLDRVGAANTIFDEEKLRWVSGQHIAAMELTELARAVEPFLDRNRYPLSRDALVRAVEALRTRIQTFSEINDHLQLIFPPQGPELEVARREVRSDPKQKELIKHVKERLDDFGAWDDAASLGDVVRAAGKALDVGGADLFHPVRKALTGEISGPDLGKVLAALGREEALNRLAETLRDQGSGSDKRSV